MSRRRIQLGLGFASLTLVLSAAAFSNNGSWSTSFAQYPGTVKQDGKDEFRFVIVGDRTTAPQWGLMPQAFREINLLCPDFVISVGDLIDGYGENPSEIARLWKEFDGEVATLKSPFVYVPGNHDIWNATSRGIYQARYGPTYRSFNYRGLHFVTLDTEERDEQGKALDGIQRRQLAWLKSDIAANRQAAQILIFLHRPIWESGGFDAVYPMLEGLPVCLFAGHHHRYSYQERRGIPHVVLSAVAGSMSREESDETGYFRHYIFATARGSDLKLALVRLGGVISPDVTFAQKEAK